MYTEDTYYKILEKLANSNDTTTKVSQDLGVSPHVVCNILSGRSHLYLKSKYPDLYSKMEDKSRECGRQKIYAQETYIAALFLLANTDLPTERISKDVGLPTSILYDI